MQDEHWLAILNCDSSYDGQFYYAVTTTGIFCRPSCKSKTPLQDHVIVYNTVNAAIDAGFRACKRCKPDQYRLPVEELSHKAMEFLDSHYHDPITLDILANDLHINKYHLHHTFKRVVGMTPIEYVLQKRIMVAKELLANTEFSITTIAMEIGFKNTAHFSTVFRKKTGVSPSEYRNQLEP